LSFMNAKSIDTLAFGDHIARFGLTKGISGFLSFGGLAPATSPDSLPMVGSFHDCVFKVLPALEHIGTSLLREAGGSSSFDLTTLVANAQFETDENAITVSRLVGQLVVFGQVVELQHEAFVVRQRSSAGGCAGRSCPPLVLPCMLFAITGRARFGRSFACLGKANKICD
jgi:hypothetical protein